MILEVEIIAEKARFTAVAINNSTGNQSAL